MPEKIKGLLKTHLQAAGADDLADTLMAVNTNTVTYRSKVNPAIVLRFEHGKAQLLYGNNDSNLPMAKIVYNGDGSPAGVCLGNSGRGGEQTFSPDDKIVGAILTAAQSHPQGRGFAVAALAKAAHATNIHGDNRWGTNLVTSSSHMDTINPDAARSAVDGIRRQWRDFMIPALNI